MALSAYMARLGDAFATIEASHELSLDTAAALLTALRLATRTVMSLHSAIGAAQGTRERVTRWKRRRKGGEVEGARIAVRHSAVELIPELLHDFGGELRAKGQADAAKAFLHLAKVMTAVFDRVPGSGAQSQK
jgi:hypothetical protein